MSRRRSTADSAANLTAIAAIDPATNHSRQRAEIPERSPVGRDVRLEAWRWALANKAADGSLPPGREIALQYGRHERWGRLVKRSGLAGELSM